MLASIINNCNALPINQYNKYQQVTMDMTFYQHLPSLTLPSDTEFSTCQVEPQKSPKIDFKGLTLKQYFDQTYKASNAHYLRTLENESSTKLGKARLYKRISSKLCLNTPKRNSINKTEMPQDKYNQRCNKLIQYSKNDELSNGRILHSNIFAFANPEPSELHIKNSINLISKINKCYRLSQGASKTKQTNVDRRVSLGKQHEHMKVRIKSPFKIRENKQNYRKIRNYSEFKERAMERNVEKEGRFTELFKEMGKGAHNTTNLLDCLRVTKHK